MVGWDQVNLRCQHVPGTDQVHTKVQDFLMKFGELLPTIFGSTL